ncbi:MAG: hypothetical protein LBG09_00465 [Puniceicoccales bacterium]|jgi:hypothetical protein|nr:hypothetical protein [Puniceicoccales bacterium]
MVRNKTIKLRIYSIGLLLSMGYGKAVATDSSPEAVDPQLEAKQIAEAFRKLKDTSGAVSEEEKREARKFLHDEDIFPEACFKLEDVERVRNGDLRREAMSIVHVENESMEYNPITGQVKPGSFSARGATGNIVNLNIRGLEGRCVITCAHAVLPEFENNDIKELVLPENGGDEVISFGGQEMRHFKQNEGLSKNGSFLFGKENGNLTITEINVRLEWGKISERIPVTHMYFLPGKKEETGDEGRIVCYDLVLLILYKPIKCEEETVFGFPFDQFSLVDYRAGGTPPYHVNLEKSPGEAIPEDECPVVIGYGWTGLCPDQGSFFSGEEKRNFFGSGVKKAITLRGLDLMGEGTSQNVGGCGCVGGLHLCRFLECLLLQISLGEQWYDKQMGFANVWNQRMKDALDRGDKEQAKICADGAKWSLKTAKECIDKIKKLSSECKKCLEEFKNKKSSYSSPLCGSGFSGSLIFRKNGNEGYDALAIYSGPWITPNIIDFIKKAGQYQHENYEQPRIEGRFMERFRRWFGF